MIKIPIKGGIFVLNFAQFYFCFKYETEQIGKNSKEDIDPCSFQETLVKSDFQVSMQLTQGASPIQEIGIIVSPLKQPQ